MKEQYKSKENHKKQYRTLNFAGSAYPQRRCTFCGAEVEDDDMFCSECGNALGGIICPRCGTLSLRNFCSNCNYPINSLAQNAIKEAQRDPRFQKAQQLAAELSALEERISQMAENEASDSEIVDSAPLLSEEDRAAAASYAALFDGIADLKIPATPSREPAEAKKRRRFCATQDMLKDAVAEYKSKVAELQEQIASMLPEPDMPPEEKRNFFCARKITQIEMRTTGQEWVCNYCGCHHSQPSGCVRPELGGKWILVKTPHPITQIIYD